MTADDVSQRLGLEPGLRYVRRTGHGWTTRMLCEALAAASEGKRVHIAAHSPGYANQLVRKAWAMAGACGVDPTLIEPAKVAWNYRGFLPGEEPLIFRDHYDPIGWW
jgi:hypothetical protein